jgi:hypothetical protein
MSAAGSILVTFAGLRDGTLTVEQARARNRAAKEADPEVYARAMAVAIATDKNREG